MLNRFSLEIWAGVRIDIFLCPRNFWKFGQRFPSYPSHFRHGYMFLTTCVVGGYGVYILDNWYWEYTCSVSLVCSTDWWLLVKFLQCKSVLQRTEARRQGFIYWWIGFILVYIGNARQHGGLFGNYSMQSKLDQSQQSPQYRGTLFNFNQIHSVYCATIL